MARPALGGVIESPDDAPLQAEIAAIRAARAAALAGIPVQFHADGSRFAVLGGLIRAYAVARIGADGSLDQGCVDSEDGAFEWLAIPPAPAAVPAPAPAAVPAPAPGKGGK